MSSLAVKETRTRAEPGPGLSVVQVFSVPSSVQHGGAGTVVRAMNEFFHTFLHRNTRVDSPKNVAQLITSANPPYKQIFGSVGSKGVCLRMCEVFIVCDVCIVAERLKSASYQKTV